MVLGSSRKRADIHNNHILTNSAPLGRVGPRVAMSVCLCVIQPPNGGQYSHGCHMVKVSPPPSGQSGHTALCVS